MALYHTYRPQQFADVVGQEPIVTTITNQIKNDQLGHAYLFSGPRGVGKTTVARLIAKSINGAKKKGSAVEPDVTDQAVIDMTAGRAIDVIEIDAASHTGVDMVREHIIENARFRPTSLPYKVFIIDEVHMLSTSAFNALLKTLEEPPAHVIFILATTELHKVPETIISRCQRFTFKRVPFDVLKETVLSVAKQEKVKIDEAVADRIVAKSDGCVRDAMSFLDQLLATGEKKVTEETANLILPSSVGEEMLDLVKALVQKDRIAGLDQIQAAVADGRDVHQFGLDLISLLRDLMIVMIRGDKDQSLQHQYSATLLEELTSLATSISHRELIQLIDKAQHRVEQTTRAPLPELPLEMLVVEWCDVDNGQRSTDNGQQTTEKIKIQSQSQSKSEATQQATVEQKSEEEVMSVDSSPSTVDETVSKGPSSFDVRQNEEKEAGETATTDSLTSNNTTITLEQAQQQWNNVIAAIEADTPSISFILKMASITAIDGPVLTLTLPYSFHKDKLSEGSYAARLAQEVQRVYGPAYELTLTVDAGHEAVAPPPTAEAQELAAAFGGEVI